MHVNAYEFLQSVYRLIAQSTPVTTPEPTTAVTIPVTVAPINSVPQQSPVPTVADSDTALYSVKLVTAISNHAVSQFNQSAFITAVIGVIGDAFTDRMAVAVDSVTAEDNANSNSKRHYNLRQRRRMQSSDSSVKVLYTIQHIQGLNSAQTVSSLLLAGDVLLGNKYATAAALTSKTPLTVATTADTNSNVPIIEARSKGSKLPIATVIGGSVAGAVLLAIIGTLLSLANRRRKARAAMSAKHSYCKQNIGSDKQLSESCNDTDAETVNITVAPSGRMQSKANANGIEGLAPSSSSSLPIATDNSYKGSGDDVQYSYTNGSLRSMTTTAAVSNGINQKASRSKPLITKAAQQSTQQPLQQQLQNQHQYTAAHDSSIHHDRQSVRHTTATATATTRSTRSGQEPTVLSFTTDSTDVTMSCSMMSAALSKRESDNHGGLNADSLGALPKRAPALTKKASSVVQKLSKQASSLVQQGVEEHGIKVIAGKHNCNLNCVDYAHSMHLCCLYSFRRHFELTQFVIVGVCTT
jgi:hypothetical protein